MRALRHTAVVGVTLLMLLGLPFFTSSTFRRLISSDPDAVSSATAIVDAPSGDYLVLINRSRHTNPENLAVWQDFFAGREIPFIFEDLVCGTASGDMGGIEMARSYQSRLPENQMKLEQVDPVLLMSKADAGRFDVIVLSAEAAEKYGAESVCRLTDTEAIKVKGAAE